VPTKPSLPSLTSLSPFPDPLQVAKTLGHLARASVIPNTDYVDFEVGVARRLTP
jgi:hypothetical protein